MKRIILIIVAIFTVASVAAFDGDRRGFVARGGLGVAPYAHWSASEGYSYFGDTTSGETATGLGFSLILGYGWSSNDVIAWAFYGCHYSSDFYSKVGQHVSYFFSRKRHGSQNITEGYMGPVWYHYFGKPGETFFTAGGLGFYHQKRTSLGSNDIGPGLLLGGGYEFSKQFSIASYFSLGQSYEGAASFNHMQFTILLEVMGY